MERKIAKLERDLLRRVSQLLYEVRDPVVQQALVSISKTVLSNDLRVLKVYVTVKAEPAIQEAVITSLKRAARFIRGRLGENLDLRFTPELRFHLDDSPERAARIDDILKGLPQEEEEEEEGAADGEPDDASKDVKSSDEEEA